METIEKLETVLSDLKQFLNQEVDITPQGLEASIETLQSAIYDLQQAKPTAK